MVYWFPMTRSEKAVITRAWQLHGKPSYATPEAQRYWYRYICHDKCYWSLLCTHGSCTHVTHMTKAQSSQESARAGDEVMCFLYIAHTKETALISGNKSMSLDLKFTDTQQKHEQLRKVQLHQKNTRTRILSWQLPPAVKVTHCNSVCGPPSFPVQLGTELSLQR